MDGVIDAIFAAWKRIGPTVESNPIELARRLARRRVGIMQRPPRAWCVAVRASDTRINPGTVNCWPEIAAYPKSCLGKGVQPQYGRHEVTLTSALLRRLAQPYYIPWPGISVSELAEKLGCYPGTLTPAVKSGKFTVEPRRGVYGRRERRVFTRRQLSAGRRLWLSDNPLWGTEYTWLNTRVPDGIEQTIERVPSFWRRRAKGKRRGLMEEVFSGWHWICPGCAEPRRTLFFPLPRVYAYKLLKREAPPGEIDGMPEPSPSLACHRCHKVLYFTSTSAKFWNHLIAHLSGGMLYGHEVPRKDFFKEQRQRPYKPRIGRAPSKRREQVLQALLRGLTYREIAAELGMALATVENRAHQVYQQHRVHCREDLAKQLGVELPEGWLTWNSHRREAR